jgi:hypothetical protein
VSQYVKKARGRGRVVTALPGHVRVELSAWADLFRKRVDRKFRPPREIPRAVTFTYVNITHVEYREPGRWWQPGKITFTVKGMGDPWRTFGRWHRPITIRFGAGDESRNTRLWRELYDLVQYRRGLGVDGSVNDRVAAVHLARSMRGRPQQLRRQV